MNRLVNQRNYRYSHVRKGEDYTLPSLTVPDSVPTPRELLARFKRGENVAVFDPVFTDSEFIPDDYERLDKQEKLDMARELKASIAAARARNTKPPGEASAPSRAGGRPHGDKSEADTGGANRPGGGAPPAIG